MTDHSCALPEGGGSFLGLYQCPDCKKLWSWAGFWFEVGA